MLPAILDLVLERIQSGVFLASGAPPKNTYGFLKLEQGKVGQLNAKCCHDNYAAAQAIMALQYGWYQ